MNYYSGQLPKDRNTKLAERLLVRMRKRWPAAFQTAKPLKVGIRGSLISAGLLMVDVDMFLTWYVQTPEYLKAQAEPGAQRYDLNGNPVGPVTSEQGAYAAQCLAQQGHQAVLHSLVGDGHG